MRCSTYSGLRGGPRDALRGVGDQPLLLGGSRNPGVGVASSTPVVPYGRQDGFLMPGA